FSKNCDGPATGRLRCRSAPSTPYSLSRTEMHESAHRARRISGSLLPPLRTACDTYGAVDLAGLPTGAHLRVPLGEGTIRGSEGLRAAGSPVRGRESVGGRLVQRDPDWLLLHVPLGVNPPGLSQPSIGQDVAINRSDVLAVETRELNRSRTALAVAAA